MGGHPGCLARNVTPRQADGHVPLGGQREVALAVPGECSAGVVDVRPVELDAESLVGPECVDFEEAGSGGEVDVHLRRREVVLGAELEEALVELLW